MELKSIAQVLASWCHGEMNVVSVQYLPTAVNRLVGAALGK